MQNTFECIFKLIVALTFLMCVVCSHYQYSFLMFTLYYYFHFIFFVFFYYYYYFLERKTEKREVKLKKIKKVESRIKFSIWNPFWSNYFFRLIN